MRHAHLLQQGRSVTRNSRKRSTRTISDESGQGNRVYPRGGIDFSLSPLGMRLASPRFLVARRHPTLSSGDTILIYAAPKPPRVTYCVCVTPAPDCAVSIRRGPLGGSGAFPGPEW